MARVEQLSEVKTQRVHRYFSESFKKAKVAEIEKQLTKVSEVCKEYQVSGVSVYRWIYKYSKMRKRGIRQVVELESDTLRLIALKEKIKSLEQVIGQKQVLLDFNEKMIELAEEEYQVDIKKKFGSGPFVGSGKTEAGTRIK